MLQQLEYIQIFKNIVEIIAGLVAIVLSFMKSGIIYEYFVSRYGAAKKILMDRGIRRSEALKQVAQEAVELAEFKKLTGVSLYNSVLIPAIVDFKNRLGKDFTVRQVALISQFFILNKSNKVSGIKDPECSDRVESALSWLFIYCMIILALLSGVLAYLYAQKFSIEFFAYAGTGFLIFIMLGFMSDLLVIFTAPIYLSKRIKKHMLLQRKSKNE